MLESLFSQNISYFQVDSPCLLVVKCLPKSTSFGYTVEEVQTEVVDKVLKQLVHKIIEQVHFIFALKSKQFLHFPLNLLQSLKIRLFLSFYNFFNLLDKRLLRTMEVLSIWCVIMFEFVQLKFCLFQSKWQIVNFGFQESILLF